MKRFLIALLLVPALFSQSVAQDTPTAQQVMDKYLTAIGGKEFLATVNDLKVDMSAEFNGNPTMITLRMKAPNKFSRVINANGMEVMRITSDGSKIAMGGMQGSRTLDGAAAQSQILQNTMFGEMRYADLGVKSNVVGVEAVDGKDAYKVVQTSADGTVTWTDFYDKTSGLKVQTVTTGRGGPQSQGPVTMTTKYSDYKDFKGLKYPTTIAQTGGRAMEMTVDKVKVNDGVKESEFDVK